MREILLGVIVVCGCALGLFRPQIGLLFYIWYAIFRPDYIAFAVDSPFSMMLAVATLLGSIRQFIGKGFTALFNPIAISLMGLLFLTMISSMMAVVPGWSFPYYYQYIRIIAMAMLIPVLMSSLSDLRNCLLVIGASLCLLGTKFGLWGFLRGGVHFKSGHGGFMSDNNTLALALVMGIPLAWYALSMVKVGWSRLAIAGATFFTLGAIVMSYSRGALLSLSAVTLLIAFRSRRKILAFVGILAMFAPAALLVLPTYSERVDSILNYEEDTSAMGRIAHWQAALRMSHDYPLFGVGFGSMNERMLISKYLEEDQDHPSSLVIHNTYLQFLVDSGIITLTLYVSILWGTIFWLGLSIRSIRKIYPDLVIYPAAIQVALVAFMIGSTFLSRVDFDLTYMLLMCAASWGNIERQIRNGGLTEPIAIESIGFSKPVVEQPIEEIPARPNLPVENLAPPLPASGFATSRDLRRLQRRDPPLSSFKTP